MIYEARVTGKYSSSYWVQIPTKYGQQDVGPIKATGIASPSIGQIVYVGYLPTADTFVILAGPEGTGVISWADIVGKPTTFTPASHTHPASAITSGTFAAARLPLVTTSANGAMLASDKVKLDAATASNSTMTLVMRDSNGVVNTATPTAATHSANKAYVDAQDALKAPLSHTHAWADITNPPATFAPSAHTHAAGDVTSGTFAAARLPVVTSAANGAMLAADKVKLDAAGYDPGASKILMTNASNYAKAGAFFMGESTAQPTQAHSLTRKDYVDAGLAKQFSYNGGLGNVSINEVLTPGVYYQGSASNATIANGYPWDSSSGTLLVYYYAGSTTYIVQEWIAASDGRRAFRSTGNAGVSWRVWNELASTVYASNASNLTAGTVSAARLPLATSAVNGAMSAADKAKLDGATVYKTPNTIPERNADGNIEVGNATNPSHAATKGYVDGDGWVNVQVSSGFFQQGTASPQVRKAANRVFMRWGWSGSNMSPGTAYNIGVIPVGYRPSLEVHCPVASNSVPRMGTAVIQTNGVVVLKTGDLVGNYYLFDSMSWDVA